MSSVPSWPEASLLRWAPNQKDNVFSPVLVRTGDVLGNTALSVDSLHQLYCKHYPIHFTLQPQGMEGSYRVLHEASHTLAQAQSLAGFLYARGPNIETLPLRRATHTATLFTNLIEPLSLTTTASFPERATPPSLHFPLFTIVRTWVACWWHCAFTYRKTGSAH